MIHHGQANAVDFFGLVWLGYLSDCVSDRAAWSEATTLKSKSQAVMDQSDMASKKALHDRDQILLVFVHGFRGSEASFQVTADLKHMTIPSLQHH
jgi:hypothetical protein